MNKPYQLPGNKSDGLDARLKERGDKEWVDVLMPNPEKSNMMIPTGFILPKAVACPGGFPHKVGVGVGYRERNNTKEILLQQRGPDVGLLELRRDLTVTGHIKAGEGLEDAILREGEEEINLKGVEKSDLNHLWEIMLTFQKGDKLIKHYAHYLFFELKPEMEFEPSEEVEALKRRTENEIFETLERDRDSLVPFEQIQPGHRAIVFSIIEKELEKSDKLKIQEDLKDQQSGIILAA